MTQPIPRRTEVLDAVCSQDRFESWGAGLADACEASDFIDSNR
jgi:hypothetical protein